MDISELSLDERETHISQTAQERIDGVWRIYTDDPVQMRRLDKVAEFVAEESTGGRHYRAQNNQISIRKPYKLTKARREALARAREAIEGDDDE